jgi:hypothetical protein
VTAGGGTSEHERLVAALKASRTSAQFFQLIHPDDRERAGRLLGDLLENGHEIEYEFRAIVSGRIV